MAVSRKTLREEKKIKAEEAKKKKEAKIARDKARREKEKEIHDKE